MDGKLILIPFISALIGWLANYAITKMLFHPHKPIKILGISFQGLFPKRQKQFAATLGKALSEQMFSFKDVEAKITSPENIQKLMPMVDSHIDHFLRNKLSQQMPMIAMFIGDKTIAQLKTVFMGELETLFPQIMSSYINNLEAELDIEKTITEKISALSSYKLEQTLNQALKKEFRFFKISGAIVGFVIGLIQLLIYII